MACMACGRDTWAMVMGRRRPRRVTQQDRKQYPKRALAEILGVPFAGIGAGDGRSLWNEAEAERAAVAWGLHPFTVWPDMIDHVISDCSTSCRHCDELFMATAPNQAYCSNECRRRANIAQSKRWYDTAHGRQITRERQRAYYHANAERIKDRKRAQYWANNQLEETR